MSSKGPEKSGGKRKKDKEEESESGCSLCCHQCSMHAGNAGWPAGHAACYEALASMPPLTFS